MTQRPSHDIGSRVARYRKMAGLSARELSDKLGGEMSRGVIANIESGRKTDVTVDQLLALAWALDVPPAALALPVEQPNRMVAVVKGDTAMEAARASSLVNWFLAKPNSSPVGTTAGPGRGYAQSLLRAVEEYRIVENLVRRREQQFEDGETTHAVVEEAHADRDRVHRELRDLGVDLTDYRIDE